MSFNSVFKSEICSVCCLSVHIAINIISSNCIVDCVDLNNVDEFWHT